MSSGQQYKKAPTYFFAWKNALPSSLGRRGTTRSSARKSPFSRRSIRRASKGFHLPLSFSMPTTRETNLTLFSASRSLYSRCGSLVIRQMPELRGSMSGWASALYHSLSQ